MKLKRSNKLAVVLLAMFMLVPWSQAAAAEMYTYNFDKIEVVYAAEFKMYPTAAAQDHWLTQLAGGTDKPIEVMYGMVHLYNGERFIEEQFIKMSGEGGSERFLSNSMRNDFYDSAYTVKRQTSVQFWSGKKLEGKDVVKDFGEPLKSVTLIQSFDPQGNVTGFQLNAQPLVQKGTDWDPFSNYVSTYSSDPNSVNQAGTINGKQVESEPAQPSTEEPKKEEPKAGEQPSQAIEAPKTEAPSTGTSEGTGNEAAEPEQMKGGASA
ncbi:hypothetical protein ACFFSY_23450 [Paenibacillus aurantiacus]|uniref:Uncharacterized protein n=1 Tax=Paenibacillus aurantiacus TaxID=1936118 RepID=A0ABV5KUI8_9BACL